MKKAALTALCVLALSAAAGAQDWPIYKGNIYFTGNNDEIVVKNNNLKWLYQAGERTFNPVPSDGRIYFLDKNADLYALDEEYGRLQWKVDFQKISVQFKSFTKSAGKVKYPLVKGNTLFLSDPVAIYALDKTNGSVLWARTGMRTEELPAAASGLSGRAPLPQIDGIYADPVVSGDALFYGTRTMFLSRETRSGRGSWENRDIKTYSAYPTFYDDKIITQSMDYGSGIYSVYCLTASDGKSVWKKDIDKPQRIFPPVVYNGKVYIPVNTSLCCLDLGTGELLWKKDYGRYITSNPGFTDRAVLFCLDNADITAVSPQNGEILSQVVLGPQAAPSFITVRDIVYAAYNVTQKVGDKDVIYGAVKAVNFTDNSLVWEYRAPFPGAVSQPSASKGILFLPAGNYIYALGTEYYAKVVQGGDGFASNAQVKKDVTGAAALNTEPETKPAEVPTRPLMIHTADENGKPASAQLEIRKWEKGKVVYSRTVTVNAPGEIQIPAGDGIEIIASAKDYIPKKIIVNSGDKKIDIVMERIQQDKVYIADNITFEYNKAYLKKESLNLIDAVAIMLKQKPGLKLEIRGHTDSTGDGAYNVKLSERRADAVKDYLVKNGISPERLMSKGFGSAQPVASNDTDAGRAKNRRTEFVFK